MRLRKKISYLVCCLVWSSITYAASSGNTENFSIASFFNNLPFRPLVGVTVGDTFAKVGLNQTHFGTDHRMYIYTNTNNDNQSKALLGGFIGGEIPLYHQTGRFQFGNEYDQISPCSVTGIHTAGQELETSTLYHYSYNVRSQQLLAVAKLLGNWHSTWHPYVTLGVGSALNNAYDYRATTDEDTASFNLTPSFNDHRSINITYDVGLGLDADLTNHFRLGAGYRFIDLGKANFSSGQVAIPGYSFPSPFALVTSHILTSEVIAQLGYVF